MTGELFDLIASMVVLLLLIAFIFCLANEWNRECEKNERLMNKIETLEGEYEALEKMNHELQGCLNQHEKMMKTVFDQFNDVLNDVRKNFKREGE